MNKWKQLYGVATYRFDDNLLFLLFRCLFAEWVVKSVLGVDSLRFTLLGP